MVSNSLVARKEDLERELAELIDVKHLVEGELFQKYFATPFYQEKKKLKTAYDCKNMYDLKYTQGRYEGLQKLFDVVDEIENRARFIRSDIEKI